MKLRFLPLMIIFSGLSLCIKMADVIFIPNSTELANFNFFINNAQAASEGETIKKDPKTEKPSSAKQENEVKQQCRNSIAITGRELCTPGQIELLKQLSERRTQIDKQSRNIIDRENVIKITENQVNRKIQEIKDIRTEVQGLLKQLEQKEDEKIDSLVKIYQNMKAKDAARIFEELEMNLLLQVVNKMKEAKSAAIIALMDPGRARELTTNIASKKVKPEFCNCKLGDI